MPAFLQKADVFYKKREPRDTKQFRTARFFLHFQKGDLIGIYLSAHAFDLDFVVRLAESLGLFTFCNV